MPQYKQTIHFEREFVINAENAKEANDKLQDAIDTVEFYSDARCEGFEDFEDEPVECPTCKGNCTKGDSEEPCDRCNGDGQVPFGTALK